MASNKSQLPAAELMKHPEFDHTVWELKPDSEGRIEVAKRRGGPFKLFYEVHGHGPRHLVFIMGLGGSHAGWQRQTKDFGHSKADLYSVLVFDNRGIGASDKPTMRYTTSDMAQDVLELCDVLGWTHERELHVLGVSMGGMIAQELALAAPRRVASLIFISTAPYSVSSHDIMGTLCERLPMLFPKSIDRQLADMKAQVTTEKYINAPDTEFDESGPHMKPDCRPFPTMGDRFAAGELHRRQDRDGYSRKGFFLQFAAAGLHRVDEERMRELAEQVGRTRICVVHGKRDRMIPFAHGQELARMLGDVEMCIFDDGAHLLPMEERAAVGAIIESVVERVST